MLVVVVRPGLSDHAIPYVEHKGLLAVKAAPRSFALREVQPDGMLVVGDNIVHGDPEGTSRTLRDCPEKAEHLVDALVVICDRVAAGLMETPPAPGSPSKPATWPSRLVRRPPPSGS
jgi:hypothetical protein